MLRAEIQRALRRAPRQLRRLARLANSPGFKSFRCPRWRIKFSLERYSNYVAHSFAYPAAGKFSRASSAGGRLNLRSNIEQPDRVGRRGLSEPGGIFSRLNTYVFPWLCSRPSLELSTPRRTHRIHQWHSHKRNRKNPSCNQTKNRPQQRKEPDRHQRKQSNARRPHHHRRDRPNRHFVSL